ncbi:Uncharacterized protein TCM_003849 [Theobroma cacao]|uniref:Uncharacterized protein n=1 Tax=Theobroma cacao TaxID=3641 RepID=A0A061DNA1_THECC|nr:Uncharacterized protein TCM_003849 [Theobroma cacao]
MRLTIPGGCSVADPREAVIWDLLPLGFPLDATSWLRSSKYDGPFGGSTTSWRDNLEDRMGSHERWRTALSSTYSPDLSGGRVGMDLTSHGGLAYAVYIMMNTMMKN